MMTVCPDHYGLIATQPSCDRYKGTLGILSGWRFGLENGKLYTLGCHGAYIREFARQAQRVRLFVPVGKKTREQDTEVSLPNVEIIPLPCYDGYLGAVRHFASFVKILREHGHAVDTWYCRVPDPFAWLPWALFASKGKKILMHMVGDPVEALKAADHIAPLKRMMMKLGFGPEWWLTKLAISRTRLAVNGHTVYERYQHLNANYSQVVVSSTLSETDFCYKEDTCENQEINLLYVGFLRGAKGLENLLEAFKSVRAKGLPVKLTLVGSADPPDYEKRLLEIAGKQGISDFITLTGYVPQGNELRKCYRSADIFVFPSLSEGSPRVVLEAMANGLPVVTTRVGSVPYLLRDKEDAVIVDAGDVAGLADGIELICKNNDLRRQCIANGRQIAQEHTLNHFIEILLTMATERQQHLVLQLADK